MNIQDMYIPSVNEAVKLIVECYRSKRYDDLRTVKQYLESEETSKFIAGNATRFHNATVTLTRIGFFDYAYALAEVGHNRYRTDTDLLGDLLCYGLQCRGLSELEKWFNTLTRINKRFWTWRAYQFSFDYWMTRLPEAESDQQLTNWEGIIESIIADFKQNFKFLKDQSDCEKAYVMEFDYLTSKGEDEQALTALVNATRDTRTKNKCPQCALKLSDHYFELGNYEESLKYSTLAVSIKEDQPSISLGYTYYILAMSKEYVERQKGSHRKNIQDIYNAYDSAYLHLVDESDRQRLISSVKKQIKVLERETGVESNIIFDESKNDISSFLKVLGGQDKDGNET